MKYNIENNIDFYKELYGSLSEDKLVNDDENVQLCLITNLPLQDRYVKLKCGHNFNYDPLYKDISNHKKKFNNMEPIKTKLKYNQIRCPYCRSVQDDLLPYYDDLPYPKEHGVNYFDTNKINNYYGCIGSSNQCQYEISIVDTSGNVQCPHYGYTHYILKTKYNITNKYCYGHKAIVMNYMKSKIKLDKLELKQKKLEEKNKLKEELKEKKLAEKLKKIQEKQKSNIIQKNNSVLLDDDSENIILVDNINNKTSDTIECIQILKTGKYKGLPCAKKVYTNCLCKRHFNLENKNNE